MGAVIMIASMQFLDSTIANVAIPHMQAGLGAGSDSITWVLTSFIVASAVCIPVTGWLSERMGSRNLYIVSTVLFLVASAACGIATSLPEMVLFRVVQGVGAAFIGPLTQTVLFDINPPSKHVQSISYFGMIVMLAPICGPVLGGFLTENLNWRWVFLVNLPVGIPALAVIWTGLPNRPGEERRLDLWGVLWLGLAIAAFQLMLDRGEQADWLASWEIITEGIVAMSAFWIFLVHFRTSRHPLFARALFRNPSFNVALIMMFFVGITNVSMAAILPMLYQNVYGYPVLHAGFLLAPRACGMMATISLSAWLMKWIDFRVLIAFGYLFAGLSLMLTTRWSLDPGQDQIILNGVIMGFGIGFLYSPLNVAAFSSVSARDRPDGTSLLNLVRNMGGSIGISVMVALLARSGQVSHADLASHVTAEVLPQVDLPGLVAQTAPLGVAIPQLIEAEVVRQSAMIAYLDSFWLLAWTMLVLTMLPLAIRGSSSKPA